ncbi:MAG TPA: bifunctional precorrin-2 dehydrogenase/sirohydrochlorin ferrochelatase [Firmicutes bacterium]|nr:bifunctional precorrin-2 dehydrogenase/sirohydrochlorin ferrochelatase [Bacillota bacterium]
MNKLYPIYIKLSGKLCLVAGCGNIALRKAESLSECGARVRIVAPDITDDKRNRLGESAEIIQRNYEVQDLDGCTLAIAATDNPSVNARIATECRERGIFINSVDDPDNCDFYVPSIIRSGDVVIAVSTGGESPALAAWIRRQIEAVLGDRMEKGLEIIACVRRKLIESEPDGYDRRARIFRDFFESELWRGFLDGKCELDEEGVDEWISCYSD